MTATNDDRPRDDASVTDELEQAARGVCEAIKLGISPEIVNMGDPQADDATHLHIGDQVDEKRWARIREDLAKIPELEAINTELQAEADTHSEELAALETDLMKDRQSLAGLSESHDKLKADWLKTLSSLKETQAHLAQMREALTFYERSWNNYCGDHGVPIGLEPTERLLNDQGERARKALTSTASPNVIERTRREALEDAAKVPRAIIGDGEFACVDDRLCCDGTECGCQGATVLDKLAHDISTDILKLAEKGEG